MRKNIKSRNTNKVVKLQTNKNAWDQVAEKFFAHSALPIWGPFDIGKDENFFGKIKRKTFLDIGFGSGHSIKYLASHGAKKVYGIDISDSQYEYAKHLNSKFITEGKVELYTQSMEQKLRVPKVDFVYSVYAFGWTVDPEKTLKLIYSYLKPGGKFIWSWDHTYYSDLDINTNDEIIVKHSYHDEYELKLPNWSQTAPAYITYRKVSTWFNLMKNAGFEIVDFIEPPPKSKKFSSKSKYYTFKKASMVPCTMIWVCKKPQQ